MEAVTRRPYQGVFNVVRFNWHFYVFAGAAILLLLFASTYTDNLVFWSCIGLAISAVASSFISLLVTHYVYDRSELYDFGWLHPINKSRIRKVVNVHAGFDETSSTLERNFPDAALHVFDFYNATRHTEVSIERARKAYPPYPGTVKVTTSRLPMADESVDIIFNIFALHEVRDAHERISFIKEQFRALRSDGKVVIVEHLRDVPNFMAYNIGFFHFLPWREWSACFRRAGFSVDKRFKVTPFITVIILRKPDGNTH
ncbi:MAG TPA: methyltransferase domain-containing protein [Chryseosolibacter sp.]|nr:methyltransferase domain-containing protein [Chryseosolibacter sp.]